ncbi:MAG: hypothetical protein V9E83_10575 [Baekduia sp.]
MRTVLASALIAASVAAAPQLADAKNGGSDGLVSAAGDCSGSARTKLQAKPDDGRLEVEFEVDQNRSGVRWTVTIRRNDRVVVNTTRRTAGASGSFSVERKIANPAGTDTISARAVSSSGQTCTAKLRV